MGLCTSGASLLGNMLARKSTLATRQGREMIKAVEGTIRAAACLNMRAKNIYCLLIF